MLWMHWMHPLITTSTTTISSITSTNYLDGNHHYQEATRPRAWTPPLDGMLRIWMPIPPRRRQGIPTTPTNHHHLLLL
jgi:hypothetical protein